MIALAGAALSLGACGSTVPTPPGTPLPTVVPAASAPAGGSSSPVDSASPAAPGMGAAVVLTSPPPRPPAGLADPSTPAYDPSSGFTADAVRVLTATAVQVSLERYREEHGAYPSSLEALFPADAPIGQDGKPMGGPPAEADGYRYTGGGSTYRLSVVLDSGQAYIVGPPQ